MASVRDILQARDAVRTELRAILERHADGNLPDDARARCDQLEAQAGMLNEQERRQATLDDLDRRAAGTPLTGGHGEHDMQFDRLRDSVGILDVVQAGMGLQTRGAGAARELSQELTKRTGRDPEAGAYLWSMRSRAPETRAGIITTALPAGGPGSNVIATDYRPDEFIDTLRALPTVRQLGARVLSNLRGNVAIPKRTGSVATGWIAENAALSLSDMAFGQVVMSPNHCGTYIEFSRNMVLQSSPDIEALARSDLQQVLALELDRAAISGSGGVQPLGVLNVSGVDTTSVTVGTGSISFDDLADLSGLLGTANADQGSTGFLATQNMRSTLLKLKDANERPYGLDVLFQGQPYRFSNAHVGDSPALYCVVYANWSDLLIGIWDEVSILVNPFETTAYSKGNVQVRALMSVDVCVRHAESFAAILNAQGI